MGAAGDERQVARLLQTQREYYDLRAPDYANVDRPSDRKHRGVMTPEEVREVLDVAEVAGDVLELACGSGGFTKELAGLASTLTAVDGSPTMLDINRQRVGESTIEYVCADIFDWTPSRRYDLVFFGFWLSHVPPTHFTAFWQTVRACLEPGGRCVFVDEDHRGRGHERAVSDGPVPTATRTLADGRSFDIVKVFWRPDELEQRLASEGWTSTVRPLGATFLVGEAVRRA